MVEVDDSSENPLVVPDGPPLHHGGFVTARLSATLDALRQATYPVIALSAARLSALVNPSLTGLPAFLASGPADSSGRDDPGVRRPGRPRPRPDPHLTRLDGHASISLGLEEHASFSTQAAWGASRSSTSPPSSSAASWSPPSGRSGWPPTGSRRSAPRGLRHRRRRARRGPHRPSLTDDLAAAVRLVQQGL